MAKPRSLPGPEPGTSPIFTKRLHQALGERGRGKRYALAIEIGVNPSSVTRWLKGGPISVENLVAICKALDVSMDWLVLGRGSLDSGTRSALSPEEEKLIARLRSMPPRASLKLLEFLDETTKTGSVRDGPGRD